MRGGLFRQRRDVKSAERYVSAPAAVVVGEPVGTVRRGDVDLDDNQVGRIVQVEFLDVLVLKVDLIVVVEVPRKRCQTERRKQRVLDRAPEGPRRFGQGGKNHLRPSSRSLPENQD